MKESILGIALALLPVIGHAGVVADSGIQGGVVVHLNCGDGKTTAEMANNRCVVHGLDKDSANVNKARKHIYSKDLHGRVSVARYDGSRLPYGNNMVNLLLADALGDVPREEVMRVLTPNGVAIIGGKKTIKPWPDEIDQWTHYLHGPTNNAVAQDSVVGPPRRLQWQAGPKWTRHHDRMSSFSAMVSTGGRIFYILDEGSTASLYTPSHWALIARDAFNGKLLWRREIKRWFTRHKGLKDGPADAPRRLVACEGRVYATLSLDGPVTCLDAKTGKTIQAYKGTENAEEILLANGTLFVLCGPGSIGDGRRLERPMERRTIVALDAETGDLLWKHRDVVAALTMAVDGKNVYYFNFDSQRAVSLDRKTGRQRWTSAGKLPTPPAQKSFFASKLVVADGVVLLASGEYSGTIKSTGGATKNDTLTAISAESGKTLWTAEHPPSGYSSPEDVFVIDGIVWCGTTSNGNQDGTHIGFDLKTGEVKHRFPADQKNYWFHHRCYSGRATCNYILTSRTGLEYIDFRRQKWDLNHWVRGACLYGVMPANGLTYGPPAPCICYAEAMLHSFNALAPAALQPVKPTADSQRLEKGLAYARPVKGKAAETDWPTYRGSNSRFGAVNSDVPAKLARKWELELSGRLSSVTVADGKVFVAQIDRHTIHAIDAEDGTPVWHFIAGGRVDSPPTFLDGRVLFGCADGYVYCLDAVDGALMWRFQAALIDRRILVYEQLESLWPVHGSVLVREGIAHFVAGRSSFVDGGMCLYRVDARSGEMVSKTPLTATNPTTGEDVQDTVKWLNMAVGRSDVLSSDGQRLYMRSQAFDLSGKRLAMGPKTTGPTEGARQGGKTTHLFCPTGFLDDTWFHRTYWLYGETFSSGWCGYHVAGKHAPAGKIMTVGDEHVFVFGRQPKYYRWTVPMEYRLFAAKKHWQRAKAAKAPPPAKAGKSPPPAKAGKAKRRSAGPAPVDNPANYLWSVDVPILVRAMALTPKTLFIAGPPDVLDESAISKVFGGEAFGGEKNEQILQQEAALDGKRGGLLRAVSTTDGKKQDEYELDFPPVFDGVSVGNGCVYIATVDGKLTCLAEPTQR